MLTARLLLISTALIWGSTFVATKILLGYVSPVEVLGLRLLLAFPVLLGIIRLNKIKFAVKGNWRPLLVAAFVIGFHFIIQITGIKYTTATNTGWIISLTPLVVAVFAFFLLKERIGIYTIWGIVIASMGILLLVSKGHLLDLRWLSSKGDWLVLASAHTWAIYTILTRDISRRLNPLVVTFVVLAPSAIVSLGIMGITSDWQKIIALPADALISLIWLAVMGTALGHWFWQHGVAKMGAAKAGVFLYLEPIATTAVAVPYLHETFGLFTAIGGGLVLLGVWLAQRRHSRTNGE